jgi:hypothetical protein
MGSNPVSIDVDTEGKREKVSVIPDDLYVPLKHQLSDRLRLASVASGFPANPCISRIFFWKAACLPSLSVKLKMEGELRKAEAKRSAFKPCVRGNLGVLSNFKNSTTAGSPI